MFKELLREYIKIKGLSQIELANLIGDSQQAISDFLKKDGNPQRKTREKYFQTLQGFEEFYLNNTSKKQDFKKTDTIYNKNGNKYDELEDGTYDVDVPLIPFVAYASYLETIDTENVDEDFQTTTFNVDRIGRGNYKAFITKGDSMNGGRINDTPDGAKVLGRELGRHHWKDGFKPSDYGWIILCKQNIFHKDIIDLNFESGEITCHSRNKSPEYSDFTIPLNDCYQIFKVIKRIF